MDKSEATSGTLVVIQGPSKGKRFGLVDPVSRIGREECNSIQVVDDQVSRQHAEIRVADNQFALVDLQSSNGTFVNGERIERITLKEGDQIQLGQHLLRFSYGTTLAADDLAERINLLTQKTDSTHSRIVRSFSHTEGSRILQRPSSRDLRTWEAAYAHLRIMYEVSQVASTVVDPDTMLATILGLTFQSIPAERGAILLSDPGTGRCEPKAVHYRRSRDGDETIDISSTIVDQVLRTGEGVRTSSAANDERFNSGASIARSGIAEALCAPLHGRSENVGVIYLDSRIDFKRAETDSKSGAQPKAKFDDEQLRLLIAVGHQTALAIENGRYYEALIQSERLVAVGQTVATLSHHVKNILQGIRGGSHLIEMGLEEHEEEIVQRGWQIVQRNQNRIYNLVMDMLSYSKDREPIMEETNLEELVREIIELVEPQAKEKQITLGFKAAPEIPPIPVDPEAIHRAVLNLVSNAMDAVEEKERAKIKVAVRYDKMSDMAEVHVTDNGVGIKSEELPHVFTLFESSKGARGTGIGLAVSHKIVQEHGGEILVESEAGRGTRFTIRLPFRDRQSRQTSTMNAFPY